MVLGPLLARLGRAEIPLPGGCVLGPRPVDQHLMAMQSFGASTEVYDGSHSRLRNFVECRYSL